MPELANGVAGLNTRRLGRPTRVHDELGSTNDELLEWARSGAPHGACVRADRQSAGRGRQGRSWWSPDGSGLYFSVLLRSEDDRVLDSSLALVAGVAVAAALEKHAPVEVGLKWPNDLLLRGAKLGGILCESRGSATVVGVGINLLPPASGWPAELGGRAVALGEMADGVPSRDALLASILEALEPRFEAFRERGLEAVAQEWRRRDVLLGQPVRFTRSDGSTESGVGAGVDPSGRLLVETARGIQAVLAGEVHLGDATS